ncbi:glycosyltransferase [Paraburkholderia tropica]|uniref:glycosyltransferase n=3 Tax=Burkholderiaceae TaxID=119060 RepID=UPI002AAFBD3A|nr:glycosyltransferase [Paraburkholderia tropica]
MSRLPCRYAEAGHPPTLSSSPGRGRSNSNCRKKMMLEASTPAPDLAHVVHRKLILYFNGTFVNNRNGAHVRVTSLLNLLISYGCKVTVYSYSNHVECPWGDTERAMFSKQYPGVALVLDRRSPVLRYWGKAKKKLSGVFPNLIPQLIGAHLPTLTPNYDRLRKQYPDALFIVNYANGLLELNGIDPECCVIETHDIDFLQFSKRFGHALTSRRIAEKFRSETGLLQSALSLLSIARTEAGMFRLFFPHKPVFFLPKYSVASHRTTATPHAGRDIDLLFIGSRNPFNVDGILHFINEQRDLLQRFSLAIAGEVSMNPEVVEKASAIGTIQLLGFVDDLDALYRRAKIVIAPVDGTGLKIKVVEALAAGKPVFGSRHSLEGLPPGSERCAFLIDAAQIRAMLSDAASLNAASEAALAYSQSQTSNGDIVEFRQFLDHEGVCQPAA